MRQKTVDALWFCVFVVGLVLCMSMIGSMVHAAELTLDWIAPTENTDGTPLTDLDGYNIFIGTSSGRRARVIEVTDETATSFVVPDLDAATTYFVAMKAYTKAGLASNYSNEVSKTTPEDEPSPPNPPVLTVSEDRTVYSIEKSHNFLATIPFGTVAPDTECDGSQPIKGMYVVPVEAVTWTDPDSRAEVVVAACHPGS